MAPPETSDSSTTNDGMEKPIDQFEASVLVKFLSENPDAKLFVEDTRGQVQRVSENDGLLVIGENQTLQACFGKDRLGLPFHLDRFSLTQESLDAYRRIVKEKALAVTEIVEVDDYMSDFVKQRRRDAEAPKRAARKKFEDELKKALVPDNIDLGLSGKLLVAKMEIHNDLISLLSKAGLTPAYFRHPYKSQFRVTGISGKAIADTLSDLLIKNGAQKTVNILRANDKHKFGPFALLLAQVDSEIFILNKECTLNL